MTAPSGEVVELADIGLVRLLDEERVRVWDVSLRPGECHPWHRHHNPYIVLSLQGGEGRMDWLDGAEPRLISEYRGGAVYRPVSPVHRLTNIGTTFYRNRLIELKHLGEHLERPRDIGNGGRSERGEVAGPPSADGRQPVLLHRDVSIWTVSVAAGQMLDLAPVPHVLVRLEPSEGDVMMHEGGVFVASEQALMFVVELTYLTQLASPGRRRPGRGQDGDQISS